MGVVRMGPPAELITKLKETFGIKRFIETGTYRGDTAYWASRLFPFVTTIEYSTPIYEKAVEKYGRIQNIDFIFGDSRQVLQTIAQELNEGCIFWLDSHWIGGESYGKDGECALLEELSIIAQSKYDHFIFIDDARLFTSPPPPPHKADQWPDISSVLNALNQQSKYTVIIEDVIISIPVFAKGLLVKYCQDINELMWIKTSEAIPKLQDGIKLVMNGLRQLLTNK